MSPRGLRSAKKFRAAFGGAGEKTYPKFFSGKFRAIATRIANPRGFFFAFHFLPPLPPTTTRCLVGKLKQPRKKIGKIYVTKKLTLPRHKVPNHATIKTVFMKPPGVAYVGGALLRLFEVSCSGRGDNFQVAPYFLGGRQFFCLDILAGH